jgi:hypothetical protein
MVEALTEINQELVSGIAPGDCIIAVMSSLEECLGYNREIKRMLKARNENKHEEHKDDNRDQWTEGQRENDGGEIHGAAHRGGADHPDGGPA